MTAFTALYAGICDDCGHPFAEGALIRRIQGGYAHATCPGDPDEAADRAALASPACTRCGLHHPGDC